MPSIYCICIPTGLLKADGTPTKGRNPKKLCRLSRSRKKKRYTEPCTDCTSSSDTEGSKENVTPEPPEKKKKGESVKGRS